MEDAWKEKEVKRRKRTKTNEIFVLTWQEPGLGCKKLSKAGPVSMVYYITLLPFLLLDITYPLGLVRPWR